MRHIIGICLKMISLLIDIKTYGKFSYQNFSIK